jgi:transposase
MTWKPFYLIRKQMEEPRLEGGRLLKTEKLSKAEIAQQLGVSRPTISDWAKKVEAKGFRGLRKQVSPNSQRSTNKG